MARFAALTMWAYLVWVLLTWTFTLEQQLFGVGLALLVAGAMTPLGAVVRPWRLLEPRRAVALGWLILSAAGRIAAANARLARRIWAPSRPLASGMVVTPTDATSDAGLAAVGLTTSLIVTSQIVDLDRENDELQYHTVAVPADRRQLNGPIEALVKPLARRPR
jgi:multicomponent Na+:H+ antiporter subunit E